MTISYFKRFRMEIDLTGGSVAPAAPAGFFWEAWSDSLLSVHAEVKYQCFRNELDARVFPNLGDREGCARLMREIRNKPGFLPGATWLIAGPQGYCGTVQGVVDRGPIGAIQNVGVIPYYRGVGLGRALVAKALGGFQAAGLDRAYLEVTAQNTRAVNMYRAIGFKKVKTLYKAIEAFERLA